MTLTGKVAVVTGSTKGIGRAIATALVDAGSHVVISSRNPEAVTETVATFATGAPDRVVGKVCDVRDLAQVQALIAFAGEVFGGLDILVNNAGVAHLAEVATLDPEAWREVIDTNLTGAYYCCHAAIPKLRARGGGEIVNIGSLAGTNAHPRMAAYNAAKFGLLGFSEALFQEVRHDNIRVTHLMPGSVQTDFRATGQEKTGWALKPEDIAAMVLHVLTSPPHMMATRIEMRATKPPKR
ncbi:MAG: SDR family oxidoreductase [Candidatus Methylomirabilales bacterium]